MSINPTNDGDLPSICSLQENLRQQQAKISALMEIARKSDIAQDVSTAYTQEKVKHIAEKLSNLKTKARSRQNLDKSVCDDSTNSDNLQQPIRIGSIEKCRNETPGSEKFQLVRKQMAENKLKMVEQENSKRGIEQLVTQLKAKFDSTQQSLEQSTELGRSMGDLSSLVYSPLKDRIKSATDLTSSPLNLDKERIKILENRVRRLEKQLEKEKNSTRDDNESSLKKVKELENKVVELEEAAIHATIYNRDDGTYELQSINEKLSNDLADKKSIIKRLEETIDILEIEKCESTGRNIELSNKMDDLNINRLKVEKLNSFLLERVADFENNKFELVCTGDGVDDDAISVKQSSDEYIRQIQALHDKISQLEIENDDLKKMAQASENITSSEESSINVITSLEATIQAQREQIENQCEQNKILEEQLTEKAIECNVINANFSVLEEKIKSSVPKSLFSKSTDEEAEVEISKLKNQLDDSNKSMIKMKLKSKQLQKQIEKFTKLSDVHAEYIKMSEKTQTLIQRIAELEDENGNLQEKLVRLEGGIMPSEDELENKIHVLEKTCQNQNSAIQLLEVQKLDISENLQTKIHELTTLKDQFNDVNINETSRFITEMESIQMEEQLSQYCSKQKSLESDLLQVREERNKLLLQVETVENDKIELTKKLNTFVNENIDLDKISKVSKSSSSAESIEIVERLTHQERLEIEEFNKTFNDQSNVEKTPDEKSNLTMAIGQDLSDSLVELREESSELMHKIDLFTTERREVLEKMDVLTTENEVFKREIEQLQNLKQDLEIKLSSAENNVQSLEKTCEEIYHEKTKIEKELRVAMETKQHIQEEFNSTTKDFKLFETDKSLLEQCEKDLSKLYFELENFRKSNNVTKLNASKKLAKEAKNTHQRVLEVIDKIKFVSDVVREENSKKKQNEEFKILQEQLRTLQTELEKIQSDNITKSGTIELLDTENVLLKEKCEDLNKQINENDRTHNNRLEHLSDLKNDLAGKYERAENDIQILKTLVKEQKQQLIESYTAQEEEMSKKSSELELCSEKVKTLNVQMAQLKVNNNEVNEKYTIDLRMEITKLKHKININKSLIAEQVNELINKQATIDELNIQIMDLYKTMEDNRNIVIEKDDEISYLQELIDTNNVEIKKLSAENGESKALYENLICEFNIHKSNVSEVQKLQSKVSELEKLHKSAELKNKDQLEKMKKYSANLKKKSSQCAELELKLKSIQNNQQSSSISSQELEVVVQDRLNEIKINNAEEVKLLTDKLIKTEVELVCLQTHFQRLSNELENNKKSFDNMNNEIHSLRENKVKSDELVQKVHLGMSQLRKHVDACTEEIKDRDLNIQITNDELKTKNIKLEKCKAVIKEKNREIQRLTKEKQVLSEQCIRYEDQKNEEGDKLYKELHTNHQKLTEEYAIEKRSFQETILRLETLHDGIQAKLQEDLSYIESIEIDNSMYKDKIAKLEECVAVFEERRSSMELRANLLDAQLQNKTDEFEKHEDALVYRLNMLSDHDDIIGQRLLVCQGEKDDLIDQLSQLKQEKSDLLIKHDKLEKEFMIFKEETKSVVENENQTLREQLATVEKDISKIHTTYRTQLDKKHGEIDELESELTEQLQSIEKEKRCLVESLEKAQDEINLLKDQIVSAEEKCNSFEQAKNDLEREISWVRLQNESFSQDQFELQELRTKEIQGKNEIDNLKKQIDNASQSYDAELNSLRLQITELDALRMQVGQNQTDDQVFIETENKRLKELLAEKETTIENYQRQNLQLQMSSSTVVPPSSNLVTDPFSAIILSPNQEDCFVLQERVSIMEAKVCDLKKALATKELQYNQLSDELRKALDSSIGQADALEHVSQELDKKNTLNSSLKQEIENTKSELQSIKTDNALNCDQLSSEKDKLYHLNLHCNHIQDQLTQARGVTQNLTFDVEKNNVVISQLQNDLEILVDKEKSLNESIVEKDEEIRMLKIQHRQCNPIRQEDSGGDILSAIESCIIPSNSGPSLNMLFSEQSPIADQFEKVITTNLKSEDVPIAEEVIVPKTAYLCHPGSNSSVELPDLGDVWGGSWGSEESTHQENCGKKDIFGVNTLVSLNRNIENELQQAHERIMALELERDRLAEQKQELQIKSGKLMKKLKEYKTKVDDINKKSNFRKSSSVESSDLDAAIQDELKSQIQLLEDKLCESLKLCQKTTVDRDNLLKRIDTLSVSNERMIDMKQRQDSDVHMYQTRIQDLSTQLQNLKDWEGRDSAVVPLTEDTVDSKELQVKIDQLNDELNDTRVDRDELQAILDEERVNRQLVEKKLLAMQENISISESQNKDSYTKNLELNANELFNYKEMVDNLKKELEENKEVISKMDSMADLYEQQLAANEKLRSESNSNEKNSELMEQLHEKEAEIEHLKQKIEDVVHEDQTEKLVIEILTKNQEIHMLKMYVKNLEEEKSDLETNLSMQITKEMGKHVSEETPKDDFQNIISELRAEKDNMEQELEVLNQHVLKSLEMEDKRQDIMLQLDTKNIEIAELKKSLDIMRKQNASLSDAEENNKKWESLIEQKCAEIAESWRQHLESKEFEYKQQIDALRSSQFTSKLESSDNSRNDLYDPELIQKMQIALESQELEIVTLKDQLALRSAEYARLAAQHDPYQLKNLSSSELDRSVTSECNIVSKSELDLALYMLHQRDMKCEELTLELVSLLGERDTLQLKLSNSLRQIEQIKTKGELLEVPCDLSVQSDATIGNQPTPKKEPVTNIELSEKLSQLHSISYTKDKRFQQEREQRIRRMETIQQDVANIPQQAVSQLVGSDISQSNQSPSSVLINWLWGTPSHNQT